MMPAMRRQRYYAAGAMPPFTPPPPRAPLRDIKRYLPFAACRLGDDDITDAAIHADMSDMPPISLCRHAAICVYALRRDGATRGSAYRRRECASVANDVAASAQRGLYDATDECCCARRSAPAIARACLPREFLRHEVATRVTRLPFSIHAAHVPLMVNTFAARSHRHIYGAHEISYITAPCR